MILLVEAKHIYDAVFLHANSNYFGRYFLSPHYKKPEIWALEVIRHTINMTKTMINPVKIELEMA